MISFEQAVKCILDNSKRLPAEKVLIEDSVGRMLMEEICSPLVMPPFNKSAMDGYALKAEDIKKIPVELKSIGLIPAGQMFRKKVRQGECVKIMTGAALPEGTDTVVKVEDTWQKGDRVEIKCTLNRGAHVCSKGEDVRKKQRLFKKGTILSSSNVALLAATGRRYVKVIGEPKVGVLNTGGEIIPAGRRLSKRQIYNSNGPQFLALLKTEGITADFLGIAKDNPGELKRMIKKGLKNDVLLISGGVSKGDYDFVPNVLKSLGVKKIFHGVKIKPGKPLFFGKIKNTLVFGVPGNPLSSFLAYYVYIRYAIYIMMGKQASSPVFEEVTLKEAYRNKTRRKHFVLVKVLKKGYDNYVSPLECHGSADILALSKADGFMVVDENVSFVKAREKVKFFTWKQSHD